MHLLITRPEPDASAMRDMLDEEGVTADVAPLLEIAVDVPDAAMLIRASALVVTSRNGLRALEASPLMGELLDRPLLVVGRGTGKAAKALGFCDVTVGPAMAKDLLPLIIAAWREKIVPKAGGVTPGPVLHLSGDKISFDLEPALTAVGIPFARDTVYRSQPVQLLPADVVEKMKHAAYDAVVLMSPLTADTYVDLVRSNGLVAGVRHCAYLCLSQGIAEQLGPLGAEKVKIAAKPNIEEMLALIRETAAQSAPMSPPEDRSDTQD
jgi:uroporphyrinogen-III synthase